MLHFIIKLPGDATGSKEMVYVEMIAALSLVSCLHDISCCVRNTMQTGRERRSHEEEARIRRQVSVLFSAVAIARNIL